MEDNSNDLSSFLNVNEKGSDTLVFQLGSHTVKFGLASQYQPLIIPNCIAYRIKSNEKFDSIMDVDSTNSALSDQFLNNLLTIEQETLKKLAKLEKFKGKKISSVGPQNKTFNQKIYDKSNYLTEVAERKNFEQPPNSTATFKKALAITNDLNEDISDNNFKWTSIASEPSYLVGREALTISESDKYVVRYPIKYGFFNNNYTFQSVCDDIHKIVDFCVNSILQIKRKDYVNYNVVLIIPDLFIRTQIKGMINVFMKVMGFKSIFLHLESVLSTFGAALQSACVIDIGSTKVSVCCLEDGLIVENSLIRKNYGGDDITGLLYTTLKRKNLSFFFPIDSFNIDNPYHYRIFEKLKEAECEIPNIQNPQAQFIAKNCKVWQHKKNSNTKIMNVTVCEAIYTTPLGLFYPDIFSTIKTIVVPCLDQFNDIYYELYTDPEDTMDELIKNLIAQHQIDSKKDVNESARKNPNSNSMEKNEMLDDSMSVSDSRTDEKNSSLYEESKNQKKNTYENMFKFVPVEDMVCQSIMSITSSEVRKKIANCILLVGGGGKFRNFIDMLEEKLIEKLTTIDNEIERVEVLNIEPKTVTWIGGSIIPKLDSAKDMFISRERWLGEIEKTEETNNVLNNPVISQPQSTTHFAFDEQGKIVEQQNKEKIKKKDKHMDGGMRVLREKAPFVW